MKAHLTKEEIKKLKDLNTKKKGLVKEDKHILKGKV